MADTPTISSEVLALLDWARERTFARLAGMTDAEYLWEPVRDVLTVRADEHGAFRADPAPRPEPVPAPVATIAWRMWHIARDCLRTYRIRFLRTLPEGGDRHAFPGTAAEGVRALRSEWDAFRDDVAAMSDAELMTLMGPHALSYAEDTYVALVLHALDEIIHHSAELGLLRDLYARQQHKAVTDPTSGLPGNPLTR